MSARVEPLAARRGVARGARAASDLGRDAAGADRGSGGGWLTLVLAALVLSGCGPSEPEDGAPPAPPPATQPAAEPRLAMAGGGPGRTGSTTEQAPSEVPGILWSSPVAAQAVSPPVFASVGDRRLVILGSGPEVVALDARNGRAAWSHHLGGVVNAAPAVVGDACFAGSIDGLAARLDVATGELEGEIEVDFGVESSPLALPGLVLFEETSHSAQVPESVLHAHDLETRGDRWSVEYLLGQGNWPAADEERAYAVTADGVHAVRLADGARAWRHELEAASGSAGPLVVGDRVIACHGSGRWTCRALEATTGELLWSAPLGSRLAARPAASEEELFVPVLASQLQVLSLADGQPGDAIPLPGRSEAAPVVTPASIVVGGRGFVAAVDRASRGLAWSVELDDEIAHLGVDEGRVHAVGFDGFLHCLGR